MSESIESDVKALREALEAGPTEGPWTHAVDFGQVGSVEAGGFPVAQVQQRAPLDIEQRNRTAAHIAACSPDRIKRVLDHLDLLDTGFKACDECCKATDGRQARAVGLLRSVYAAEYVSEGDWQDIDAFLKEQGK